MCRILNKLISALLTLVMTVTALYAAYALWDDHNLIAEAENVRSDLLRMKPSEESDAETPFSELRAVNPDVCAWLTLEGTAVDHPVLQGETNLSYINTNVYGEFAMSGSIFLDVRCDRDFTDSYMVLYGHHMADHAMFGDLPLYKDAAFFRDNKTGTLILPDGTYSLEIAACLVIPASEERIYDPSLWQEDCRELLDWIAENAVRLRKDTMDALRESEEPRMLAMSTCSYEFTNARTVVIAAMVPAQGDSASGDSASQP